MPLRESKGNMYPFITHTWNPIKGRCFHDCEYCYMRRWKLKELRLDERELRTDLGSGWFIFVGSSTDMWAETVPPEWIRRVLRRCDQFDNTYLFQSKNPVFFKWWYAGNVVWGTTIETNRWYPCMGKAPNPGKRQEMITKVLGRRMVTIEPILDFDLEQLCALIFLSNPEWVNIGADSQGHHLPEPPGEKIIELIQELRGFTDVKVKKNLGRIVGVNKLREVV